MLDEIKKILQSLKKGVVVVENGKPSYVVVPFDEFEAMADERKGPPRLQAIDDASLIQKMIDAAPLSMAYDEEEKGGESAVEDGEIKAVLNALDREKEERERTPREVNLEDLPF